MKRYMCAILLTALVVLMSVGQVAAGSSDGAAGQMPAYYDGQLFTSNFKEMPAKGTLLQHNKSINTISMCDACAAELNFVSVRDAIQGGRSWRCVLPCCAPILAGAGVAVLPCCAPILAGAGVAVLPCCAPILAGAGVAVLPCCSCDAENAAGEDAA